MPIQCLREGKGKGKSDVHAMVANAGSRGTASLIRNLGVPSICKLYPCREKTDTVITV
jgi:hypothetical protein